MSMGGVPQALIGAVDDWLLKQGKPPQIGAGQSPSPVPTNTRTPMVGATPPTFATPSQTVLIGAPKTTAPAAAVPVTGGLIAPDTAAQPPTAGVTTRMIGAAQQPSPVPTNTHTPMVGATPQTLATPSQPRMIGAPQPAAPAQPAPAAGGLIAPDTAEQPPVAAGATPMIGASPHDYAADYSKWAASEPAQLSPDAGKPSMLRKIGGIATGALIGALNPQAGAQIGGSIVGGPRRELEAEHKLAEDAWTRQGNEISKEAGLADTESQIAERNAQAGEAGARADALRNPKPAQAEVSHTYVDGDGNEVGVMKDGTTKILGAAQRAKPGQSEITHSFVDAAGNEVGVLRDGSTRILGKARPESGNEGTWSLQSDDKGNAIEFNSKTGATRPAPAGIKAPRADSGPGAAFDRASAEAASKDVETARGGDFRFRSMAGSYPKAVAGDQQAMVNLLTSHIGMTLGMQRGARITKDILHEAQASTPWLQGLTARWDSQGYLSGVVLTKQQMDQMMGLATQQRANAWSQAIESARQAGVADKLKIPSDVRITVSAPDGKLFTLPASQLSQAEDQGYTVAAQ
ncbi:MAG: hypothetical protein WAU89_10960 [Candidatus Acidiferrales bacterium]